MKHTGAVIIKAVFSIIIFSTSFCMSKEIDTTPAAKAGDEPITRAFVIYIAEKLGLSNATKEKKTELVQKIIENIAIASRARAIGLNTGKEFALERDALVFQSRMEYLCTAFNFSEDCAEKLFSRVAETIDLRVPEIIWDKVFTKKDAEFIPYGGKIPSISSKKTTNRNEAINLQYASTINIITIYENITLAELLISIQDEDFLKISDSGNDERTHLFHKLIIKRHIGNFIARLPQAQKTLIGEIERRAEQNLLVELYREHIGFERISGGKSSRVRYPVSEEEIRGFYEKNPGMFEEPEWVEISHIRLRDYQKAVELKKKIDDAPDSFCTIAREFSTADDAAQCGYVGIVKRAKKLPLFKEFAFTMSREGEISRPFLAGGFAEIVKLHKRKTRTLPLNDPHVRRLVIEALQPIKREEKLRETIEDEKRKMHIEIFYNTL